ncbi:MAG: efflux RND transporter periplasmic adaptor subunit, partial [Verrucomicrobia bacterium]|nr:efflux RND transporter periplasmic adaptor subunit [Verrucomicrobiota bacterium]
MANAKSSGWLLRVVFLIVLGGAGWGVWTWRKSSGTGESVTFRTNSVVRGDIIQLVKANGAIVPVKNVTVGSQVSGIIKDLKADFNSRVTEGDLIAQIDPSTFEQNVGQAEAEVANSRAGLELAQVNFKRANDLREAKLIPISEYDKALADMHQAEAGFKIKEASLKKANVDLDRTKIYAPISGLVIIRAVEVGQTVAASMNAPTLFQIAQDLTKMRIEAAVSEA